MSISNLSNMTRLRIESIPLFSHEQNTVKKCVAGYSRPNTILGTISWIAYRIFNAFKSIFGQSDWQRCKKILSTVNYEEASQNSLYSNLGIDVKALKRGTDFGANISLKILVITNEVELGYAKPSALLNIGQDLWNGMKLGF